MMTDEDKVIWTDKEIAKENAYLEQLDGNWNAYLEQLDGNWVKFKEPEPSNTETEFVLVETIITYRMRYVVEVEKGDTPQDHIAEGQVIRGEAKEFSQLALGETVVSTRVIEKKDIIALCDEDNDYAKTWRDDQKMANFVETINYFEGKKQ
jgi:hypothetical protein